jgi:hypothetical protein
MISYTVTVYNEVAEIAKLLHLLKKNKSPEDELIVVQTYKNDEDQNTDIFLEIQKICKLNADIYQVFHFQNKFSDMKNYVNSLATRSYIINLDADELVSDHTISCWKKAILENPDIDLFWVPRINTLDSYTIQDIENYQWNINSNGWINWPDYQSRICKNLPRIKWYGHVHEHLQGAETQGNLPSDPQLAIIHHKNIEKQRQQNILYETISKH